MQLLAVRFALFLRYLWFLRRLDVHTIWYSSYHAPIRRLIFYTAWRTRLPHSRPPDAHYRVSLQVSFALGAIPQARPTVLCRLWHAACSCRIFRYGILGSFPHCAPADATRGHSVSARERALLARPFLGARWKVGRTCDSVRIYPLGTLFLRPQRLCASPFLPRSPPEADKWGCLAHVQSLISQGSQFPLRKPAGFHYDFALLGLTTFLAGLLGVPAPNGLIPQAPIHTRSLLVHELVRKDEGILHNGDGDGDLREVPTAVVEQRVSNLAQGALCLVLLTKPFLHVLNLVPQGTQADPFHSLLRVNLQVTPPCRRCARGLVVGVSFFAREFLGWTLMIRFAS